MSTIIGIDLGTTNSTVAYSSGGRLEIRQFLLTQQITDTREAQKPTLPSFHLTLPEGGESPIVGWYAQQASTLLPEWVIASAKSWLCHPTMNRRKAFLPIGACPTKWSPVQVCASFLQHIRLCWEESQRTLFGDQRLLITVPASFDPSAQELIREAAESAGYPAVRLLEEPLAAFYAWLYAHQEDWRSHLHVGDTILVIDIGGGTTDFSLIAVEEQEGALSLTRRAVGGHLLLGGDNIDIALARFAEEKLAVSLDPWQWESLVHACRQAKEELLGVDPPDQIEVSIRGKGSSIVGGTLTALLQRAEVEALLVEGFFPQVFLTEPLYEEKRSGIAQIGLLYARDPRITVQLAHFLSTTQTPMPTAVLFNGGTLKAHAFQQRILSLLSTWKNAPITHLQGTDLDFAVSQGAVYYGWTRAQGEIRVKAPICRSYYIGIEHSTPAIPGVTARLHHIPIVPFGMEEGTERKVGEQQFALLTNESTFFRFFSRDTPYQSHLTELPTIEASLPSQVEGEENNIALVTLTATVTDLGMLELWCAAEDGRRWKVEFAVRT